MASIQAMVIVGVLASIQDMVMVSRQYTGKSIVERRKNICRKSLQFTTRGLRKGYEKKCKQTYADHSVQRKSDGEYVEERTDDGVQQNRPQVVEKGTIRHEITEMRTNMKID